MSHRPNVTSVAEGHFHTWCPGDMFTSFTNGHRHNINTARAIPVMLNGHGHLLLNQEAR